MRSEDARQRDGESTDACPRTDIRAGDPRRGDTMLRSEIPAILAKARTADVARIPVTALAKMSPPDVAPRLQAADEMRRRARVRGAPADMARWYFDLAGEVLATDDPERAAEIIKAAGVKTFDHEPMTTTHIHEHAAFGLPDGASTHLHEHTHDGDGEHEHMHVALHGRPVRGAPRGAKAAKAAAPRPGAGWTPLQKDMAPSRSGGKRNVPAWDIEDDGGPPVRVAVPALTRFASDSATVIERAADAGQLAAVASEIAAVEKARAASAANLPGHAAECERLAETIADPAAAQFYRQRAADIRDQLLTTAGHANKATAYEGQAARVTDPVIRESYLELARREREKAGAV